MAKDNTEQKQAYRNKGLISAAFILLIVLLLVNLSVLNQVKKVVKSDTANAKILKKLWDEEQNGRGENGLQSYTFEVYYAPSTKEAPTMKENWQTNPDTKLTFVEATSRVAAREATMNKEKIDDSQILAVVNPDGTTTDGWMAPVVPIVK
ncbi:hypothetical protein Hs30E_05280 [Lactococcus hodotermopsidis]|uniref:Uncharacterized protein n=1 Tax=Pseudolactococcus hodotermopsidis TaxID=2709157 RepID=A0A6A0BDS1_9LACT|nr:hypothetical protein [Lactococcus hodotermopsidis]GFH41977.1 hypothetical protein Hs30E_05280 [Lactococcus hodotermopsidis]